MRWHCSSAAEPRAREMNRIVRRARPLPQPSARLAMIDTAERLIWEVSPYRSSAGSRLVSRYALRARRRALCHMSSPRKSPMLRHHRCESLKPVADQRSSDNQMAARGVRFYAEMSYRDTALGRRPKTEDRRPKTEDRRPMTADQ